MSQLQLIIMRSTSEKGANLVERLHAQSVMFLACHRKDDQQGMLQASAEAWDLLVKIFHIIRNENDHGRISNEKVNVSTSRLLENVSQQDAEKIIAQKSFGRVGRPDPCNLRETLNKIAHFDGNRSTYRVTRSGMHYLILSGKKSNKLWVVEIEIKKLIKRCREAFAEPSSN